MIIGLFLFLLFYYRKIPQQSGKSNPRTSWSKTNNNSREKFSPGPGDPGSNLGPGENFSLKLLILDLPDGYSES